MMAVGSRNKRQTNLLGTLRNLAVPAVKQKQ
jgi:hypothetical protein